MNISKTLNVISQLVYAVQMSQRYKLVGNAPMFARDQYNTKFIS
jgi:hypothetical protein